MTGIRARIVLVTVAVAVLAVLVTGLVSSQLVRASANRDARAQLAAQADALAAVPDLRADDTVWATLGDARFALVDADGTTSGTVARIVDPVLVSRIEAAGSISTLRRLAPGQPYIVEARALSGGGALVLALPQETVDSAVRASTGRIVLSLAIGVAAAIAAGALLATWLSRPIRRVGTAAQRLAAGERGVDIEVAQPSEVAAIAEALAALDTALTTSEGRQREFLLSISHELRTPLTALRGYGEALSDGLVPPEGTKAVGDTLVAETARLDRFVADLLELARLESDDFSIRREPVSVPELVAAATVAWSARASALGVSVTGTADDVEIPTDPQRLRQIIDGLIENALRVSPEGTAVTISTLLGPELVEIRVADAGPGLSSDDQEQAFERGVLRDRYSEARPVGTGLGLSIAARLTQRLGGTIRASSAPGGGALFTVSLPRR